LGVTPTRQAREKAGGNGVVAIPVESSATARNRIQVSRIGIFQLGSRNSAPDNGDSGPENFEGD
jgi:hypothetical protein